MASPCARDEPRDGPAGKPQRNRSVIQFAHLGEPPLDRKTIALGELLKPTAADKNRRTCLLPREKSLRLALVQIFTRGQARACGDVRQRLDKPRETFWFRHERALSLRDNQLLQPPPWEKCLYSIERGASATCRLIPTGVDKVKRWHGLRAINPATLSPSSDYALPVYPCYRTANTQSEDAGTSPHRR